VEDIAKAIAGGNAITDDQLKLAQRMVPIGATASQLEKISRQIQSAVDSRKMTVYEQGGVYGKIAAKDDPWLDENSRKKILGGDYSVGTGAGASTGTFKTTSGNEYIF
jgi:hypothetical protein